MPQYLSPIGNDQFIDANGDPLVGGQIETYLAGSSTPAATYTSSSGSTPQSNPIILNSLGYPTLGAVWLTGGVSYKFIVKNASGSVLRTIDEIAGVNDATLSQSEWLQSGFVPTYIGATSFSVPGDQTGLLQINRRLRTTNTAGFRYSTISNSVFSAGNTTVTVVTDTGTLDAGLSSIEYALLAASPLSVPNLPSSKITGSVVSGGMTMSTARVLGRVTASTGSIEELTSAQVTASFVDTATTSAAGKSQLATSAEAITGTDASKTLTPSTLKAAQIVLGSPTSLTGTTVNLTGIPSWARRVTVMFSGLSTNGSSRPVLRLGVGGGILATGYNCAVSDVSGANTCGVGTDGTGFIFAGRYVQAAASVVDCTVILNLAGGNVWNASIAGINAGGGVALSGGGGVPLGGTLDSVRVTTLSGTDSFDAGTVTISWE